MRGVAGTLDLFQDIGGASRPDKGLGIFVVAVDVISDGHDEFFKIAKHAPAQLIVGEIPEEALHHIEPGGASGSEMHVKTGMTLEPALHFGVLVSGVVIADQM